MGLSHTIVFEIYTIGGTGYDFKVNKDLVIKEGVDQTIKNMKNGDVGVLVLPQEFWDNYKNDPAAIQQFKRLTDAKGHLMLKKNNLAV